MSRPTRPTWWGEGRSNIVPEPPSAVAVPAPPGAAPTPLDPPADFVRRHVGPREVEIRDMLTALGLDSLQALVGETVPAPIPLRRGLDLPLPPGAAEARAAPRARGQKNQVRRSF